MIVRRRCGRAVPLAALRERFRGTPSGGQLAGKIKSSYQKNLSALAKKPTVALKKTKPPFLDRQRDAGMLPASAPLWKGGAAGSAPRALPRDA